MSGFSEIMRLRERADEDIYFARRDRELIAELKRRRGDEAGKDHSTGSGPPELSDRSS